MKLTEAKLKELILEAMEEETLSDEDKEYLLNLLKHDDREYQIQGVEFASQLMNQEDLRLAFYGQFNHVNGTELLSWLRTSYANGPRKALIKFMKVSDVESLKAPYGEEWKKPMSKNSGETWEDKVQQLQTKLTFAANQGNFAEWEKNWFKFKDLLKSFYDIHAPGFWDSLSDEGQEFYDEMQKELNPSWRLAAALAQNLSRVKRDWSWSNGYSDKYDEDLEEPREPDNPKYMEGWNDAVEEIDRESRGW